MRKELCRFNEATEDGRVIVSKGTTWRSPMPLIDIDSTRVGYITNIALEGNRLYGDLDFELDEMFCLTIDLGSIAAAHDEEANVFMMAGTIMSARISPDTAYPWKD